MKGWIVGLCTVAISAGVAFAYTATLDDFNDAVKHEGCESIPYSDLRSACKSKASDRDDWCKNKGKFTCEDLDPRGLQQQIDNISDKVKAIKPLARQLIELWDKGTDKHKKISADTKTAVEQCKSFQ